MRSSSTSLQWLDTVAVPPEARTSIGVGLERSCSNGIGGWLRTSGPRNGIERLEAWFAGNAYEKHRHDTYAICLTITGIQGFDYRGTSQISLPGQIVVLHPDEMHDGRAATDVGFGYRQLYVDPGLIFQAVSEMCGCGRGSLPFVRSPVLDSRKLAEAVASGFNGADEPLAIDSLVAQLAEGLVEADPSCHKQTRLSERIDLRAVERARELLDEEKGRVVQSIELEQVTGLRRYALARQFRLVCGTSPYRYLLRRRLDWSRIQVGRGRPLAEIAHEAGFADQAHFSRTFKSTYGLTPGRYRSTLVR